uniref:T6SS Phospholipase effector Tle1-like catalytic domain-containing protein n=1 Tax=Mycena chlorophos TaxID=658473 RepID=A0ABQ0LBP0_MYCCL|nr:predicted protein [Mycena chlorophos]
MLSGHTSDVLALSSPAEDLILFASRDSTANVHAGSSSTCVVVHGPIHWCFSVPKPCFDTTKLGSSLELHGSLRRRVAVFERWCPSGDGGPPVYSPGSLPSFHRCAWRRHTMSAVGDTTPTPATPAPPTATATPRTLVLVFDGTADEYNAYNTNAVRLFGLLKKDDFRQQLCYYQATGYVSSASPEAHIPHEPSLACYIK